MAEKKQTVQEIDNPYLVPTVVMNKDDERIVVRADEQKKWEGDGWSLGEPAAKKGK